MAPASVRRSQPLRSSADKRVKDANPGMAASVSSSQWACRHERSKVHEQRATGSSLGRDRRQQWARSAIVIEDHIRRTKSSAVRALRQRSAATPCPGRAGGQAGQRAGGQTGSGSNGRETKPSGRLACVHSAKQCLHQKIAAEYFVTPSQQQLRRRACGEERAGRPTLLGDSSHAVPPPRHATVGTLTTNPDDAYAWPADSYVPGPSRQSKSAS